MLSLIRRTAIGCVIVTGCATGGPQRPMTAAEHEQLARHYEATAASIEHECAKSRRNELTVDAPVPCWKAQDVRFLEANLDAAAEHRAAAQQLRDQQAKATATAQR